MSVTLPDSTPNTTHPRSFWRSSMGAALTGLCALLIYGCQGPPDAREKISDLKVLAIKASPPSVRPGEKVKLQGLAAAPGGATITLSWFQCTTPEQAEHGCHEAKDAKALGTGTEIDVEIPKTYFDKPSELEKTRGRYLPITLVAKSGDETVISIKRIVVSTVPDNQNPTLDGLTLLDKDGNTPLKEPWKASLKSTSPFQPQISSTHRQTYTRTTAQGEKQQSQEKLTFSWYVTEGSFTKGYLSEDPEPKNDWLAPDQLPKDTTITFYLIVRDGRGGTDWLTRTLQLQP